MKTLNKKRFFESGIILAFIFTGNFAISASKNVGQKTGLMAISCEVKKNTTLTSEETPESLKAIEQGKAIRQIVLILAVIKNQQGAFEKVDWVGEELTMLDSNGTHIEGLNRMTRSMGHTSGLGGFVFMNKTPAQVQEEVNAAEPGSHVDQNMIFVNLSQYSDFFGRQDTYSLSLSQAAPNKRNGFETKPIQGDFQYDKNLIYNNEGHRTVLHDSKVECTYKVDFNSPWMKTYGNTLENFKKMSQPE